MPTSLPIVGYFKEYRPHPGDIAIDAGAFPGNFTILLSRLVGKKGVVIAVEPDVENHFMLLLRFKRLGLKNIILLNVALWNTDGRVSLSQRADEGSSIFNQRKDGDVSSGDYVVCKKLDSVVKELNLSKVAYLKMDIEGAEIEALEGAQWLLKSKDIHLAIASYHIRNDAPTHLILSKYLETFGYQTKIGVPKHLTLYGYKIKNTG